MKECRGSSNNASSGGWGRKLFLWGLHLSAKPSPNPLLPTPILALWLLLRHAWLCYPKGLRPRIPQSWRLRKAHELSQRDNPPLSPPANQPACHQMNHLSTLHYVPILLKSCSTHLSTNFLAAVQGWSCWSNLKLPLQPSCSYRYHTISCLPLRYHTIIPQTGNRLLFNSSFLLCLSVPLIFFNPIINAPYKTFHGYPPQAQWPPGVPFPLSSIVLFTPLETSTLVCW